MDQDLKIELASLGGNGDFSSDLGEIIGNDAPADPTVEALFAMIATAVETVLAFEHTDTAFNPNMEAASTPEPRLGFVLATSIRLIAGFG